MRKKIISVLLIAVVVFGYIGLSKILSDGNKSNYGLEKEEIAFSENADDITESVISQGQYEAAENDNYILEVNGKGDIHIRSKKSNKIWFGVPESDLGNSKYSSSVILNYFADNTTKETVYSSQDAVNKEQYRIYKTNSGIRVEYIFGEMTSKYIFPDMISKERMEKYVANMSEDDRAFVLRRYQLHILDEYEKNEQDYLLAEYPRLANEDLYVLEDVGLHHMAKRMDAVFREAGYTREDMIKDTQGSNVEKENPQTFKIAILYELTQNGFKASVDMKNCVLYDDYPIESIQILPYFDCLGESDNGYFMLPSGSGAIAEVNSGTKEEGAIALPVYGNNITLTYQDDIYDNSCLLPVYGVYKNDSAYLCVLNQGAQQATINAEITNLYSSTYPSFSVIDNQKANLSSESVVWLSASNLSAAVIESEYFLIENTNYDNAYSKMAEIYRNQLIEQGILSQKNSTTAISMVANIVNTINYDTMVAGCIPVNKEFALTTFEDTLDISKELSDYVESNNLYVLLSGWNKKGLGMQNFNNVSYSTVAGGKKGLLELQQGLKNIGVKNFLNVDFNVIKPHSSDGFSSGSQAARDINNSVVSIQQYDAKSNEYKVTRKQLVSPKQFEKLWNTYKGSEIFEIGELGVNQLTQMLYSDYANGANLTRDDHISLVEGILKNAKEQKMSLIGDGANMYAIKYVDIINNVPVYSNNDNFFSKDIPFIQMVLHGYKQYAATTLNDLSISEDTALKLIETGSGISCRITKNSFRDLFDTEFTYLYNTNYSQIKDTVFDTYKKVSRALNGLNAKVMVSHNYITEKVVKIAFEDSTIIILNYGDDDYKYGNEVCLAHDYLRIDS